MLLVMLLKQPQHATALLLLSGLALASLEAAPTLTPQLAPPASAIIT